MLCNFLTSKLLTIHQKNDNMLNIKRIKLYLEKTSGKSIHGLGVFMEVAPNTIRSRIETGDCMLSEVKKIHEYTGIPYEELVQFKVTVTPDVSESHIPYGSSCKEELERSRILVESLIDRIQAYKDKYESK